MKGILSTDYADVRRWLFLLILSMTSVGCTSGGAEVLYVAEIEMLGRIVDSETGKSLDSASVEVIDTGLADLPHTQARPKMHVGVMESSGFQFVVSYGWCNFVDNLDVEPEQTFTIVIRKDGYEDISMIIDLDDVEYDSDAKVYRLDLGAVELKSKT